MPLFKKNNQKSTDLTDFNNQEVMSADKVKSEVVAHPSDKVKELADNIQFSSPNSIDNFGMDVQNQLDNSAQELVKALNTRDTGKIGTDLAKLTVILKDNQDLKHVTHPNLIQRFMRRGKHYLSTIQASYQTTGANIDAISQSLQMSAAKLQSDNNMLDQMYSSTQEYVRNVQDYIDAGTLKLYDLDTKVLPDMINAANDGDHEASLKLQKARNFRDRLSKRVYNLKLVQQVAYQQGPQVLMVQKSNQNLADNINESIKNAVPLWRQQTALAIAVARQQKAVKINQAVHDLTNGLLAENAKAMHDSSIQIAKQGQMGIVDESTIENNWKLLIDQVKQVQQIQQDGDKKRNEATQRLNAMTENYKMQLQSVVKSRREIHADEYRVQPKELNGVGKDIDAKLNGSDSNSGNVIDGNAVANGDQK